MIKLNIGTSITRRFVNFETFLAFLAFLLSKGFALLACSEVFACSFFLGKNEGRLLRDLVKISSGGLASQ